MEIEHAATEDREPSIRRAWLESASVCLVWVFFVLPGLGDGKSATIMAILSGIACIVLLVRRNRLAIVHGGKVPETYEVTRKLAIAFGVMTATAIAFSIIDARLSLLADTDEAKATLHTIAEAQGAIASLADFVEAAHLGLMMSGVVLLLAIIMMACGRTERFRSLFTNYRRAKTAFERLALVSLCVGSFSLAGSATATNTLVAERRASYTYTIAIHDAEKDLANRVDQQIAQALAKDIVLSEPFSLSCPTKDGGSQPTCAQDPVSLVLQAHDRASKLGAQWPAHPAAEHLPENPETTGIFAQASLDTAEVASLPAAPSLQDPVWRLDDEALETIQASAAALPPVDPAAAARREHLSDLVDLLISGALEATGVSFKADIDKPFGKFVTEIGGTVTGSLQERAEEVTRDTSVRLIIACRQSPAQCRDEAGRLAQVIRADPRIKAITNKLSAAGRTLVARYRKDGTVLAAIDSDAEHRFAAATDDLLKAETEGPWGALRSRWAADLSANRITDLTANETEAWNRFFRDWDDERRDLAVAMVHREMSGDDWDKAFLAWTDESPDRAAIWGYVVLNDQGIRPYLLERQPSASGKEIHVGDAYMLFVATVRHLSWAENMQTPESDIIHGPGFRNAVEYSCPNNT